MEHGMELDDEGPSGADAPDAAPSTCVCDSGLQTQAADCGSLFCPLCVRWHGDCVCETHHDQLMSRFCAGLKEHFLCEKCFPTHECACLCGKSTQVHHSHCPQCGYGLCEECLGEHACGICPTCRVRTTRQQWCGLCSRVFCKACIRSHACACTCEDSGFEDWRWRKLCPRCLQVLCRQCEPSHEETCKAVCGCGEEPPWYRCDCGAHLCEKCVAKHQCATKCALQIRQEFLALPDADDSDPVVGCGRDDCLFELRVGTWNMNHISASTKGAKLGRKKESLEALCSNEVAQLDLLGLQEVNATAVEGIEGLSNAKVLKWGPLLKSQSYEGRLEFARSFPLPKPRARGGAELEERRKAFYQFIRSKEPRAAYQAWWKAVRKHSNQLRSEAAKAERQEAITLLERDYQEGENIYKIHRQLVDRYQEYYPLLVPRDSKLKAEPEVDLYWGIGGGVTTQAKDGEVVYFRGSNAVVRNDDDDEADAVEFRPVVVYHLKKKCAKLGCTGLRFHVGLVHTSPDGAKFERIKIYQNQLEKAFSKAAAEGGFWIIVGDYYLDPEAIVGYTAGTALHDFSIPVAPPDASEDEEKEEEDELLAPAEGKDEGNDDWKEKELPGQSPAPRRLAAFANTNRNAERLTFVEHLPAEFDIVASVSGTNAGTWRPPLAFDSATMQVADFGVCSTNWLVRRGFSLRADTGQPSVLDENHEAFRGMKSVDTSDHSPVLVYVARNHAVAMKSLRAMLGYDSQFAERASEQISKYKRAKAADLQELQDERAELLKRLEATDGDAGGGFMTLANEYRRCTGRLASLQQVPQGVSLMDFAPTRCADGNGEKEVQDDGQGVSDDEDLQDAPQSIYQNLPQPQPEYLDDAIPQYQSGETPNRGKRKRREREKS